MRSAVLAKKSTAAPAAEAKVSKTGGLRIGETDDAFEREADRVADQVMASDGPRMAWSLARMGGEARLRRKCACGGSAEADGECEECKKKETLQRRSIGTTAPSMAPPIVHEVLALPGRSLDQPTRSFFESRLGHDFSRVRIHTGGAAEQSARSVGALAYTVGRDVVFAANQYAPMTTAGRTLLAHELTHVLQQDAESDTLRRYAAEAEAEEEEDEEEREEDENTAEGRIFAHRRATTIEDLKAEFEEPVATTKRGGAASENFIEKEPPKSESAQTQFGTLRFQFTPTIFHMLDALESDVAAAKSENDILDIYRSYFKDSAAASSSPSVRTTVFRTKVDAVQDLRVTPEAADPDGTQRTAVFLEAVKRRTDVDPTISTKATIEAIIQGWVEFEARQAQKAAERESNVQGPCQAQSIPRKGGNTDHDSYAKQVTGQDSDFEVATPAGTRCAFDGLDANNPKTVWEVKTRHDWASMGGITSAIFNPKINRGAVFKMEAQMERCRAVAMRCGFTYKWAFEDQGAAEFVATLWRGRVTVVHIPRAGAGPG